MFLDKSKEELMEVFLQNLLPTNRSYDYYINWNNINGTEDFLVEIHAIDILIGCKDDNEFYLKFYNLLSKLPTTICLFPLLFGLSKADRKKLYNGFGKLIIFQDVDDYNVLEHGFPTNVKNLTTDEIKVYYDFFVKMGLKNLYQNMIEKSTLDYITGVLVGMDSNGRKNRGGETFEKFCQPVFEKICEKYNLCLLVQKKFSALEKYGFDISDDIENRKADFIVVNTEHKKAINFEVNFYNGTGSKPEEIIDSYINRQNDLKKIGMEFSLVTDGLDCWSLATNQLHKGFRHLQYLQNFYMLKNGMLEEIIKKVFNLSKND